MPANTRRTCLLGRILDAVWPRDCEVCGRPSDRPGRHVCADCLNRLPAMPYTGCCRRCGRDAQGLDAEFLCEDCRVHKPHFDRAASVMRMEGEARQMMNAFKFRAHHWLRDDFVDLLESTAKNRFAVREIDLVLCIPSTFLHFWNRGYNPCRVLVAPLAKRLGKPAPRFVLRRKGRPARQGGLTEEDRRTNVVNTFAVMRPNVVKGKTVLLLDDVMTTGSTLSECAKTLKEAGAARVWCLSFVRSLHT